MSHSHVQSLSFCKWKTITLIYFINIFCFSIFPYPLFRRICWPCKKTHLTTATSAVLGTVGLATTMSITLVNLSTMVANLPTVMPMVITRFTSKMPKIPTWTYKCLPNQVLPPRVCKVFCLFGCGENLSSSVVVLLSLW